MKVGEVIASEFDTILAKDTDLLKHNSDFVKAHHNSAGHVHATLRARQLLDPTSSEKTQQDMIRTLALDNTNLADASRGLELLEEWEAEAKYRDDYVAAAHERFPEANIFQKRQ